MSATPQFPRRAEDVTERLRCEYQELSPDERAKVDARANEIAVISKVPQEQALLDAMWERHTSPDDIG